MGKLYTIGHSNRSWMDFLALLQTHSITYIVDIRTIPKSRNYPWFNSYELVSALKKKNIGYCHIAELGGLRHTSSLSPNTGWHNRSFRGYADYMQTKPFFMGLKRLNQLIRQHQHVAIMCAEAVPWRCHRSLVGDAEIIRGYQVFDIINSSSPKAHKLTSFAKVDRTRKPMIIFYPPA